MMKMNDKTYQSENSRMECDAGKKVKYVLKSIIKIKSVSIVFCQRNVCGCQKRLFSR